MSQRKFETQAIRAQMERSQYGEHTSPLFLTSSFVFDDPEQMRATFADEVDGNIYSRFSNPNSTELIDKVARLEGAETGWATATGMAAVFSTFAALLESGDHIVSCRSVFGSTHTLLTQIFPKWGITHTYVDAGDLDSWEQAIQPNTKLIYLETPTNPGLEVIDLERVNRIAKAHGVLLVVDNCFATPYIQCPIEFGADIVIHSATKYMDGQGRVLGGLILGTQEIIDRIQAFARHSGPAISPFNAWTISKSLETLAVRMEAHSRNALRVAEFLENHPKVERTIYPFLESHPNHRIAKRQMSLGGGMVGFIVKGGLEAGRTFLANAGLASLTANLGDTRTIVTHPASTTHSKLSEKERLAAGIEPGFVRVSVGLEHVDDIIADIEQALS